jgi:hypothetical protein
MADEFVRMQGPGRGNGARSSGVFPVMGKAEEPLWIWLFAAEDMANFVGRCLPALLAGQANNYFAQITTLVLLGALEDELQASARCLRRADRAKVIRLCEGVSRHIVPAVAGLPRERQLEYREVLELCALAWRLPKTKPASVRQGARRSPA